MDAQNAKGTKRGKEKQVKKQGPSKAMSKDAALVV